MGIVVGSVLIFAAFFFLRCLSRYVRVLCLRFAVVSYPPEGATYEDGDVHTLCTVCITEYSAGNEVVVLRCGHVFHPGCIRDVVHFFLYSFFFLKPHFFLVPTKLAFITYKASSR